MRIDAIRADGRPPALAGRDLTFAFPDGTNATCGVDLHIDAGEIFCLLGPNGAGKTTVIRLLTNELRPSAGVVELHGLALSLGGADTRRAFGILPQSVSLFEALSVRQHLKSFAALKGIERSRRAEAVERLIETFRLQPLLAKRAGALSLGQQRWVLVALAVLGDPPIVVLDEPTVGMDPVARRRLWDILRAVRDGGIAILLTTHYLDEAEQLSDRIGIIRDGRILVSGTIAALYAECGKSVHVSVTDPETGALLRRELFHSIDEAHRYVTANRLQSYTVGRLSLEDIYLRILKNADDGDTSASGLGRFAETTEEAR